MRGGGDRVPLVLSKHPDGGVALPDLGVGLGYRTPIRKEILRYLDEIDFLEVVTDAFLRNPKALQALASIVPCIPHSLNLSVGSDVDSEYLSKVKQIVEIAAPPWHTDHLAFTRAEEITTGHLAPVGFTEESLEICVENITKVQNAIDVPFAVETITMPFYWPNNTMEEHVFLQEVLERTRCHLLLDLENVRINAANHGRGGRALLDQLPLERIAQIHLAGGMQHDALQHDTHSEPISEETWGLLEYFCELIEPPGIIIERDGNFPPFEELLGELRRARNLMRRVVA